MTFSQAVLRLRESLHLTQTAFAEELGCLLYQCESMGK